MKYQIKHWLHYIKAGSEYNLHSPFVFDFYTKVVKSDSLKKYFWKRRNSEFMQDFFFQAIRYFRALTILEVGNGYFSDVSKTIFPERNFHVYLIDPLYADAKIEKNGKNFIYSGSALPFYFDEEIDFAVFEPQELGNRQIQEYFPYCKNDSVFVVKGIHRSKQLETEWNLLKNESEVAVSIDLFFAGILFFKKELSKQHYVLRA